MVNDNRPPFVIVNNHERHMVNCTYTVLWEKRGFGYKIHTERQRDGLVDESKVTEVVYSLVTKSHLNLSKPLKG